MWTIHTTFLAPAQGHFETQDNKRVFVFDSPPQMVTRDMQLSLTEDAAIELVKTWNKENEGSTGMRPIYRAALKD